MDKTKASPDRTEIRRVLLTFPPPATDTAVVRAVTRLAGQLRAEILGLFLKDEAVVRGAAVPFADEVRRLPATIVESAPQNVERQFQAQVRRMEALLREAAREGGIRGRLRVVTSTAADTVRSASKEGDLIAFSEPTRANERADSLLESLVGGRTHPILVVRPQQSVPLSVAVVFEPTPEGERALHVAGQIARRCGGGAVTLFVLGDDPERSDASGPGRRLSEAYGVAVAVRTLEAFNLAALAKALQMGGPGLIVVPGTLLQPAIGRRLRTLRALSWSFVVTP